MKKFDKKKNNKWDNWERSAKKKHKPREQEKSSHKHNVVVDEPIFDDANYH
jgi:hypothetical protein